MDNQNQNQQQNPVTPTAPPAVNEKKMPKKALIILAVVILLILVVVVLQSSKSKTNVANKPPISANTATEIPSVSPGTGMNTLSPAPMQINNAKDLDTAMTNVKSLNPNSINDAVSQNDQLSSGFQQ